MCIVAPVREYGRSDDIDICDEMEIVSEHISFEPVFLRIDGLAVIDLPPSISKPTAQQSSAN